MPKSSSLASLIRLEEGMLWAYGSSGYVYAYGLAIIKHRIFILVILTFLVIHVLTFNIKHVKLIQQ